MKKFLTFFMIMVILAIVVPTFAAMREIKCTSCYGSGKCITCHGTGNVVTYNWQRNEKGKTIRVPPYQKKCITCFGKKKCKYCQGKGKKQIYIPDAK